MITECPECGNKNICPDNGHLKEEAFNLIRKWIAQGNHPMRSKKPEVREAILKCATDLQILLLEEGN
jgi:hypothetical protein